MGQPKPWKLAECARAHVKYNSRSSILEVKCIPDVNGAIASIVEQCLLRCIVINETGHLLISIAFRWPHILHCSKEHITCNIFRQQQWLSNQVFPPLRCHYSAMLYIKCRILSCCTSKGKWECDGSEDAN
ncbi:hypothetical protein DKX38_003072 [Salix brachista]|uniref:Uncharacterized protein n=1 Tax=Salix brachista TaxID=2182728 RepID=A0A5N5NQ02_9ROSI|nr:hypothetical protein DKX38_003072 [Salix brachista]